MSIVEILMLLVVALVVLGPERLPEVLRTVGKILRELRSASNENDRAQRTWSAGIGFSLIQLPHA